ncbi:MAG: DUF4143 domain-containing protein, partial [Collinsella aerofaciens]
CNLLGIEDADELAMHPQRGAVFETAVVSELMKEYLNRGRTPHLSFWRDTNKNEIDVIVEKGPVPFAAIEVKSSATFRAKYFDVIERIAPRELGSRRTFCGVCRGRRAIEFPRPSCAVYGHPEHPGLGTEPSQHLNLGCP